jgi:hypothetical protein
VRSDLSGVIRKLLKQSSEVLVNHVAFAGYAEWIAKVSMESKDIDLVAAISKGIRLNMKTEINLRIDRSPFSVTGTPNNDECDDDGEGHADEDGEWR